MCEFVLRLVLSTKLWDYVVEELNTKQGSRTSEAVGLATSACYLCPCVCRVTVITLQKSTILSFYWHGNEVVGKTSLS